MIPPGKTHSVRLCATFVRTVNVPGRYGDGYGGLGLSLVVTPRKSGGLSKTWAQAVSPNGRKTSLGLGSYPVITLAMAREKALANARAIAEGRDPRRRMQQVPTFAQANETVIAIHAESWKSDRSESQWHASMRDYAHRNALKTLHTSAQPSSREAPFVARQSSEVMPTMFQEDAPGPEKTRCRTRSKSSIRAGQEDQNVVKSMG